MSAAVRNLYIEQGADWAEDFQILDEDGVADDLTGCTIEGKARDGELRTSAVVFSFSFTLLQSSTPVILGIIQSEIIKSGI